VTTTIDSQIPGVTAPAEPEGAASLDKVRDLLFGVQMRENDRKLARLEERITKETGDLRDEFRKRLSAIEALVQREVDSLSDRLKTEQDNRATATRDLSRELSETAQTLEKKTTQLDDQMARGLREARQQLHDQEQRLVDELRLRADEILTRLARESQELRTDKADRAGLAALFTEMAMRLNDQFRLPSPEEPSGV
jgi:DNA anti-recombination protein RmuC